MTTRQQFKDWTVDLERTLQLSDGILRSITKLTNAGNIPLAFQWCAHPFFPVPRDHGLCVFHAPITFEDPDQVFPIENHRVFRNPAKAEPEGRSVLFDYREPTERLDLQVLHEIRGEIRLVTDFRPSRLRLWANDRTFSIEPCHQGIIVAGLDDTWGVEYHF